MGFTVSPELVRSAQADEAALDDLIGFLWPETYRVALGVLRDPGLAEDAAQDACASIARGLKNLRSTRAFYAWMYRIVIRTATVAASRRVRTAPLDPAREPAAAATHDDRLDLLDALASLSTTQRAAVVLR
ncbi:MAG: RNA polymerase sigma factor [Candidatus Baltobacteraceae bacterium]